MPAEALDAIRSGGLNLKRPFAALAAPALTMRIFRTTKKLAEADNRRAEFSPSSVPLPGSKWPGVFACNMPIYAISLTC